jgi:C4-type Zn-finger protein
MTLNFVVDNTCPTCGSTIRSAVIDLHPTDRDAAIHSLKCTNCGYEKSTILSLRPTAPPPEMTAQSIEEAASVDGLTSRLPDDAKPSRAMGYWPNYATRRFKTGH